jgi:diguanylate cyclase (GGDEF)-like protein
LVAGVVELVADAMSTPVVVLTADHRVVWANGALMRLVGAASAPPSGRDPVMAARLAVASAGLPLAGAQPGAQPAEVDWTSPAGPVRRLSLTCRALPGESGFLLYEIVEIAASPAAQEPGRDGDTDDAPAADDPPAGPVEAAPTGDSWDFDLTTGELRWSDTLLAMLGFPAGTEIDYPTYRSLLHPDDVAALETALERVVTDREPFDVVQRLTLPALTPPGEAGEYILACHLDVVADTTDRPVRVVGAVRDVTAQYRAERDLEYLSGHDPLTDLLNRRGVIDHLRDALAAGGDRAGALLVLDVDDFKDVNDVRGHTVGDEVLRELAKSMLVRFPSAVVGRLGGDEFAIILPDGDGGRGLTVASRLCETVARRPVVVAGVALRITASVGVAPLGGARALDDLLAMADLALYEAKRAGRNCARLFAIDQYAEAANRVSMSERVRAALDAGLMALDAQPIIDLADGEVRGYELLARLRDGEEPEVGPAEFLGAIGRTDLAVRLDRWVVERAVTALASPVGRERGLRLAVNVSGSSLADPTFADFVLGSLHAARVAPDQLELEVGETTAMARPDATRRLAERLGEAGCRFALDDFGAGSGAVAHLRQVPFTTVKLDGALVRRADRAAVDEALVVAVVQVARDLGMTATAECVDREPLARHLAELGVDRGQGYHLGAPRPLADLLADPPAPDPAEPADPTADTWYERSPDRYVVPHDGPFPVTAP